ncbi:MAG TPA: methyltransferase domain-containing protein [Steroidobacteraceae bacterium]|nr:methyltransferase domain-containing protein [Steroidobacteraceae bacterium]
MTRSSRRVLPEALDELAADDPRGMRSRRDLQRVHRAMRSVSILRYAVSKLQLAVPPARILELGAGDGSLLLRFARALKPRWTDVELTLLDRHLLVSDRTHGAYAQLGWRLRLLRADALAWASDRHERRYDLCIANLFLHHFDLPDLAALLRGVAASSDAFVACEPRRSGLARIGSRLLALLGANEITRGDAIKSVAAGFAGLELSAAWDSAAPDWIVEEYPALPFTHCYSAVRTAARAAGGSRGL